MASYTVPTHGNLSVFNPTNYSGNAVTYVTIKGAQTVSGAKTFGNVTVSGSLFASLATPAQPSVTSTGTLTSLTVSGATSLGSTLTTAGQITATGGMTLGSSMYLNTQAIYLLSDQNHSLRYCGSSATFASTSCDGPALYGYSGGILGSASGGQKIAVQWDSSQNVTVPGTLKAGSLYTVGNPSSGVKVLYGKNTTSATGGTYTFTSAFSSTPIVVASMESSSNYQVFVVHINSVSSSGFGWQKVYQQGTSTNQATSEAFFWIAIGV